MDLKYLVTHEISPNCKNNKLPNNPHWSSLIPLFAIVQVTDGQRPKGEA